MKSLSRRGRTRGILDRSQGYGSRRRDGASKCLPPKKLRFDVCYQTSPLAKGGCARREKGAWRKTVLGAAPHVCDGSVVFMH